MNRGRSSFQSIVQKTLYLIKTVFLVCPPSVSSINMLTCNATRVVAFPLVCMTCHDRENHCLPEPSRLTQLLVSFRTPKQPQTLPSVSNRLRCRVKHVVFTTTIHTNITLIVAPTAFAQSMAATRPVPARSEVSTIRDIVIGII